MARRTTTSLDGAVVIVTGGARGIGAATAERCARAGAVVWIGDLDADEAERTAARIGGVRAAHLDVTDAASWAAFVARVEDASGPVDVLVNNAGIMPLGPFADEDDAVTDLILDVNVRGVLLGMRAVVGSMTARGRGSIVNVASMAGVIPIPGMVTYNASKFAAVGASLAARREYAPSGVVVSTVLPSAVRTELSAGAPLGGGMPTVDPADVADAVVDVVRTGAERRSVPRWVAPAWSLTAFVPEWLENLARRVIDDRRALTSLDPDARRAYDDRVGRQVDGRARVAARPGRRSTP